MLESDAHRVMLKSDAGKVRANLKHITRLSSAHVDGACHVVPSCTVAQTDYHTYLLALPGLVKQHDGIAFARIAAESCTDEMGCESCSDSKKRLCQ